jgi:peroxiredoxin
MCVIKFTSFRRRTFNTVVSFSYIIYGQIHCYLKKELYCEEWQCTKRGTLLVNQTSFIQLRKYEIGKGEEERERERE